MENPGAYVDDWVQCGHFCMALLSFEPPSHSLVNYQRGDEMPLHAAVGVNRKTGATTENLGAGTWYMD